MIGRLRCACGARLWTTAKKVLTSHECPLARRRVPLVRASDALPVPPRMCPDCDRAAGHPGTCTGEVTRFAERNGRVDEWAFIGGVLRSPVGAMWGLALLILLWLSGCA